MKEKDKIIETLEIQLANMPKNVKLYKEMENYSSSNEKNYNSQISSNNLGMKVTINLNSEKNITLDVFMTDSVSKIENKILEIEKKHRSFFKLIHAGRQLEANLTLGDYNIQENATIHAIYTTK